MKSEEIVRSMASKAGLSMEINKNGVFIRDPSQAPLPPPTSWEEYYERKDQMLFRLFASLEEPEPDR